MTVFVSVSFSRTPHGAKYDIHSVHKTIESAERQIKDAAQAHGVVLKSVGKNSWRGDESIVTIHEVDLVE